MQKKGKTKKQISKIQKTQKQNNREKKEKQKTKQITSLRMIPTMAYTATYSTALERTI